VGDTVDIRLEARASGGSGGGSSWGRSGSTTRSESTSGLALLSGGAGTRADTNGTEGGAASRTAVSVAQALSGDELLSLSVSNVGDTVDIRFEARAGRGSSGGSSRRWGSSPARSTKSASGLALLGSSARSGADTNVAKSGTASLAAVGVA